MSDVHSAQPGMLVVAREFRGMTQADVAEAMMKASGGDAAVSQGYVSRAESGRLAVSGERLELYAAALGYPPELLCLDPQVHGVGVGLVHHRKRASLTVSALRRQHAHLALTRVQLQGIAACRPGLGVRAAAIPTVALDALTTAKDAARQVRKAWGMPPGPAADLTASLETAGVLVVARDLGSGRLDAVSQWDGTQPPLILANHHAPADRYRFSLAHELGHLVLHQSPGDSAIQERQADEFAAEFLMPARDIRSAFTPRVDLELLARLKREWKVSMAALLRRAQSLNIVTDWQYRSVMVEMSALGYRTAEPVEIDRERPRYVPGLIRSALAAGMSEEELARCARLLPEDFQLLYAPREGATVDSASKVRP
ncbi:ImmA/IrrE family metallo-endopeptidase [Streptomyces tendae]|uniref:ImmA/IrrE family metallo-endopeptidase n=1 Tax=Streptomyces tendae TaxID=1932 RepID=UPI0037FC9906